MTHNRLTKLDLDSFLIRFKNASGDRTINKQVKLLILVTFMLFGSLIMYSMTDSEWWLKTTFFCAFLTTIILFVSGYRLIRIGIERKGNLDHFLQKENVENFQHKGLRWSRNTGSLILHLDYKGDAQVQEQPTIVRLQKQRRKWKFERKNVGVITNGRLTNEELDDFLAVLEGRISNGESELQKKLKPFGIYFGLSFFPLILCLFFLENIGTTIIILGILSFTYVAYFVKWLIPLIKGSDARGVFEKLFKEQQDQFLEKGLSWGYYTLQLNDVEDISEMHLWLVYKYNGSEI